MTTKLDIYNGALRELGERSLATVSDNTPARYHLDTAWDSGLVDYVLGAGQWIFAVRTSKFSAATDIETDFGYRYVFELPDDYINLSGIWTDEYQRCPLEDYKIEGGYLTSDYEDIYVSYISNHGSYGGNYNIWSAAFRLYVETYLALQACMKVTNNEGLYARLTQVCEKRLLIAKNRDAFQKPTTYPPLGTWSRARLRNYSALEGRSRSFYG